MMKLRLNSLPRTEALAEVSTTKEKLEDWIEECNLGLGKETVAYLKHHLSTCEEPFTFAYLLYLQNSQDPNEHKSYHIWQWQFPPLSWILDHRATLTCDNHNTRIPQKLLRAQGRD